MVSLAAWGSLVDAFLRLPGWMQLAFSLSVPFIVAWGVARLAGPLARRVVRLAGWAGRRQGRPGLLALLHERLTDADVALVD